MIYMAIWIHHGPFENSKFIYFDHWRCSNCGSVVSINPIITKWPQCQNCREQMSVDQNGNLIVVEYSSINRRSISDAEEDLARIKLKIAQSNMLKNLHDYFDDK